MPSTPTMSRITPMVLTSNPLLFDTCTPNARIAPTAMRNKLALMPTVHSVSRPPHRRLPALCVFPAPAPPRVKPVRLEHSPVPRAALAHGGRFVAEQRRPELLVVAAVPDGAERVGRQPAQLHAVGPHHHAARLHRPFVRDVGTVPRPRTPRRGSVSAGLRLFH